MEMCRNEVEQTSSPSLIVFGNYIQVQEMAKPASDICCISLYHYCAVLNYHLLASIGSYSQTVGKRESNCFFQIQFFQNQINMILYVVFPPPSLPQQVLGSRDQQRLSLKNNDILCSHYLCNFFHTFEA